MLCTDLESSLAPLLERYDKSQVCAVVDSAVSFPCPFPVLKLEADEEHKSLRTVERIWDFLFDTGITRSGLLVCVGGGIVTDLGGFAAATYKRGMDYLNIPTTLLAMIDASTGGKTGFNYRGLKNAVGCFARPVETLVWPTWLLSLPSSQLRSGFGEMLKTGLIDPDTRRGLWHRLLAANPDKNSPSFLEEFTPLISECIRVKDYYIAADPHERGLRKTLNLGHTFGHALEEISFVHRTSSLRPLLHGYAVLYGLIAELYLSVTRLGCPIEPLQQLTQLMLSDYGKPVCSCADTDRLVSLMLQDKKNEHPGEINCTLLRDIGHPLTNQVISADEAREAMEYLFSL